METVALKLLDFVNLERELIGVIDPKDNKVLVKGLLNENFKLVTKVKISNLLDKIKPVNLQVDQKKNELISKYGEVNPDGTSFISVFINVEKDENGQVISGEENPKFKEFEKDFQDVLNQDQELKLDLFTEEDLEDVRTNDNYPTFYKLVKLK